MKKLPICLNRRKLEAFCKKNHIIYLALFGSIKKKFPNLPWKETVGMRNRLIHAYFDSEIYQTGLKKAGLIWRMEPEWQQSVGSLLKSIKETAHPDTQTWNRLLRNLKEANVDAAILACTDLNVLLKDSPSPLPLIDSAACLAEAVVLKWQELCPIAS